MNHFPIRADTVSADDAFAWRLFLDQLGGAGLARLHEAEMQRSRDKAVGGGRWRQIAGHVAGILVGGGYVRPGCRVRVDICRSTQHHHGDMDCREARWCQPTTGSEIE